MATTQVILVSGSSTGFGRLMVETFARQGHTVFVGIRSLNGKNASVAAELKALAAGDNLKLHVVELDVTDDRSIAEAVQSVIETAGRIDTVVNNAGAYYFGPVEAFTAEEAQRQFDVNVYSILRMNRAVIPFMREQGSGLLIQIGSVVGRFAVPFNGLYSATKFALEGLTEAYHHELSPFGIEVSIVEPGAYPTSLGSNGTMAADQARFQPYQARIQAFGESFAAVLEGAYPQEVADSVAALIALPSGLRPLRVVVATAGQHTPVTQLNQAFDKALPLWAEALSLNDMIGI